MTASGQHIVVPVRIKVSRQTQQSLIVLFEERNQLFPISCLNFVAQVFPLIRFISEFDRYTVLVVFPLVLGHDMRGPTDSLDRSVNEIFQVSHCHTFHVGRSCLDWLVVTARKRVAHRMIIKVVTIKDVVRAGIVATVSLAIIDPFTAHRAVRPILHLSPDSFHHSHYQASRMGWSWLSCQRTGTICQSCPTLETQESISPSKQSIMFSRSKIRYPTISDHIRYEAASAARDPRSSIVLHPCL